MTRTTRRQMILGAGAISGGALLGENVAAQPTIGLGADRLVLLGVRGGPLVTGYAQTPSANLIVFAGVPFVVDTGYGVTLKLLEAGVPLRALRYLFITHHHSDHNLELGPLLYNAWVGGLTNEVEVYGPKGLNALLQAYWQSNRLDIEARIADEARPDPRRLAKGHEYVQGHVMTAGEVRVSALRNVHPPVKYSYALKFQLGRKTVVFSGDTAYLPALAEFASGADYLVHEVMYPAALDALVARRPNAPGLKASILGHHTSADDVGRIAAAAQVKTLVLNHFVPGDDPMLTPRVWTDAVSARFKGRVIVASSMLSLPL